MKKQIQGHEVKTFRAQNWLGNEIRHAMNTSLEKHFQQVRPNFPVQGREFFFFFFLNVAIVKLLIFWLK